MLFSLKSKGYHFNSALHILIYGALIAIAIGTAAHLNTTHEDANGKERPLYQSCQLNGTKTALTEKDTCIPLNGTYGISGSVEEDVWKPDDKDILAFGQSVFVYSVLTAISNSIAVVVTLYNWVLNSNEEAHALILRWGTRLVSVVDLFLLSATLGWLDGVENVAEAYNQENNIIFGEDFNLYTASTVGVVLAVVNAVFLLLLAFLWTEPKYFCFKAPTDTELAKIYSIQEQLSTLPDSDTILKF